MKITLKEKEIENLFLFLLSPFLYIPAAFYGVYKKSNFSLVVFTITFGLLSYLYIPYISNDRARYFEFYESFINFNFNDFIFYLTITKRADFLLHLLIYCSAKLQISVQFLLFGITSFTVGTLFYLFSKFVDKNEITNKNYFLCFLLILFSFSLPDLFSGIRFYFASAFVLLGFYKGINEGSRKQGILLLIIATLIHFSSILFIVLYVLLLIFPKKYNWYRSFFIASFVFVFIPKSFLITVIDVLNLPIGYNTKAELYLNNEDIIATGIQEGGTNSYLVYLFSIAWSYFAYVYLLATIKRKSIIRNFIYLFLATVNIFHAVPTVYSRYLIVAKCLFVLLVISEMALYKNKKVAMITLGLLLLSFVSNIYILRHIIEVSFLKGDIMTLMTIFSNTITYSDFLK